jgi:hypothetical protein
MKNCFKFKVQLKEKQTIYWKISREERREGKEKRGRERGGEGRGREGKREGEREEGAEEE